MDGLGRVRVEESEDERWMIAPTLAIAFRWTGERWVHELQIGSESHRLRLAHSFEEGPDHGDATRIVSPTYQEIQLRREADSLQALLIGRSGPHHFSAVVHVRDDPEGSSAVFEVADRCRSHIQALASTYVIDSVIGERVNDHDDHPQANVIWRCLVGDVRYARFNIPGPDGTARIQLAPARPPFYLKAQAEAQLLPGAATHAYRYRWAALRETPVPREALTSRPGV